jgi:hypothetical protein
MNWGQGLKRVSVLWWIFVALWVIAGVGWELQQAYPRQSPHWLLWALLFVPALLIPFVLHKATCWIARWLAEGFATK